MIAVIRPTCHAADRRIESPVRKPGVLVSPSGCTPRLPSREDSYPMAGFQSGLLKHHDDLWISEPADTQS